MAEPAAEMSFPHTVRISARARHVRLYLRPGRGLEIVVPRDRQAGLDIPGILRRHQRWIRSGLERLRTGPDAPGMPWAPPDRIAFPSIGRAWAVAVFPHPARWVRVREDGAATLCIEGAVRSESTCRAVLRAWLRHQGRLHLPPLLDGVSRELGQPYARVGVRCQRTRWGSCSRRGAISLNARLLLLAPELVRYVLVHELCHLAELNHAPRFWQRVERACPGSRALDRAVRRAWDALPAWA